jgi:PAS domain S-box-containing protein
MNLPAFPSDVLTSQNPCVQLLLDAIPNCVAVKDAEGRTLFCNKTWASHVGARSCADAVGKTDFDFFPQTLACQFQTDERAVLTTGTASNGEEEFRLPGTGQSRWFDTSRVPVKNAEGEWAGVIVVREDITDDKRAQKAWNLAQELEDRITEGATEVDKAHLEREQALQLLQSLLDNIPDAIYFKDIHSRFIKCSASLARRMGAESADLAIGKTDFDFIPEEEAREFYQDEQKVMQTGEPIINKIERKARLTGEYMWTSTTKVPLCDSQGEIIGIIGVNRDVTEQMRAEKVLRESRAELENRISERTAALANERRLLRTLIDNIPDAIYAKDIEGRKTLANPADLKNLRCTTEADAIGKTDFDLFAPDIAAKFWADDQTVLQNGAPVLNREEWFLNEQGRKCWLLSSKLPIKDDAGKVIGLVGISREITSLREAELKLEAVHKELVQASRQAGMAEVATGVLHNVGNVLNSVNVSAAIMAEKLRTSKIGNLSKLGALIQEHKADLAAYLTTDERGKRVPEYIEQLSEHLERERVDLVKEINCLSEHIGHIKQVVTTQQDYARVAGLVEKVTLSSLVEDSMKIHGAGYLRHGIRLVHETEDVPEILVDKHRVMQVLVNLFSNAKYACDSGPTPDKQVTVRIKNASPGRVKIEVEDNGMGVAAENLTRIFSQGFTTRKDGHGFGLHSGALAAKEMGGSLSVRSDGLGKGSVFTLELPVAPPAGQKN